MRKFPRQFDDPKLARKIAILRYGSLMMGLLILVGIALLAASGELTMRGASTGGRFVSDGFLRTVKWADEPFLYLLTVTWYVFFSLLSVAAVHVALAKLVGRLHGRPWFRRKYPY